MAMTEPRSTVGDRTEPVRRPTSPPPWPVRALAVLAGTPLLRWLVVAQSVPPGSPPRRDCATCRIPIGLTGPLRAISPIARCAGCGSRVGAPPGTLELAVLAVGVVLLLGDRPIVESAAIAWWAACAVPLVYIDIAVHRLPDRLTYPAAAGTWASLGIAAVVDGHGGSWIRAVCGGLGLALLFAASTLLLGRRGFGLGDAKLTLSGGALLAWSGWGSVVFGLMVAFGSSAAYALLLLMARRIRWTDHLPFGPFLVLGTGVALALPPS
ncbi:A24 family peptidase [Micromonospora polyrhachis]|uniref:Leader peptidase (Prepilin peptidase)/N-methyltransferase n=1 Tax=Micromonospora polyrhachis TaxID=1282883 RepID=A0A7W7SPR1_9ACTN|nr:A24 family peptidase [Micromonospora polyrhachis]MBB4958688.1 leader peptidase (prepilin peptidase)/N-methyltransferase [Micromonospora polyrhachis]